MFLARDEKAAEDFRAALSTDEVKKVYYARVIGNFKEKCDESGMVTVKNSIFVKNFKQMFFDCAHETDLTTE